MTKLSARKWMKSNIHDFVDECGEVLTNLVKSCCWYFNENYEYGPLDDETHWIWDFAIEVSEFYAFT